MLTLIFTYRNRDLERLKRSLDSLCIQTDSDFEAYLIDYGSEREIAEKVKDFSKSYKFLTYKYHPCFLQPWNKSRAINSVVKDLNSEFCFVADIDMIFHPRFIESAKKLQYLNKTVYFQVGFLNPKQSFDGFNFQDFKKYRKSTQEATGLSMFPVSVLKELNGFDEFYHFWGAEDSDMHVRIRNAGYEVEFYDQEILMLHQWHESYRSQNVCHLDNLLQISGIVRINLMHYRYAKREKKTKVNGKNWGKCITEEEFEQLEKSEVDLKLTTKKEDVDHLLYGILPVALDKILKFQVIEQRQKVFSGIKLKQVLKRGGLKAEFYTLKEVNDKLLLHLISFYRENPYNYKIKKKTNCIEVAIKLMNKS
ncbi:glycosyl transferase family 2 [Christiangramia gaetbulicola]|uniref:Glycosyl transferase family 2 n=1 Tax=Christiangramia gaetbulicola TaxID=703340 RepID=A0A2T6AJT3_9FLAO|nr:galactosyltransferase-related protein [Christiangramia gaetbulicola]PTX44064.1 glycosyl transferase family 2 [Christiangramia gaetbulicola]